MNDAQLWRDGAGLLIENIFFHSPDPGDLPPDMSRRPETSVSR